jgi:hypothetical protein
MTCRRRKQPTALARPDQSCGFFRVPDLTRNADIKLNIRVSLRPIRTSLR